MSAGRAMLRRDRGRERPSSHELRRAQRFLARNRRQLADSTASALERTRPWQFRRRRKIRERAEAERERLALDERRLRRARAARGLQAPWRRTLRGIVTTRERRVLAAIGHHNHQRAQRRKAERLAAANAATRRRWSARVLETPDRKAA